MTIQDEGKAPGLREGLATWVGLGKQLSHRRDTEGADQAWTTDLWPASNRYLSVTIRNAIQALATTSWVHEDAPSPVVPWQCEFKSLLRQPRGANNDRHFPKVVVVLRAV